MNIWKLLLAVLLLQTAVPQRPRTGPVGSIEGVVVGARGEPLPGVSVTLTETVTQDTVRLLAAVSNASAANSKDAGMLEFIEAQLSSLGNVVSYRSQRVTTGPDGKFIFENLLSTAYFLGVERQGYVTAEYGQKSPHGKGTPLIQTAGQNVKDLRIVMMPNGVVTGRIVDRNGEPISHARVQALQISYSNPAQNRSLTIVESVTTNDMGEYRLFWLPPGSYFVSATPVDIHVSSFPLDFATSDSSRPDVNLRWASAEAGNADSMVSSRILPDGFAVEEAPVPVFYPGTFAAQEAKPVVVRAAATIGGVDITAPLARVHRIRGVTFNGLTGQPQAMSMALIPKNGFAGAILNLAIRSTNGGAFEIPGVVPGSYFLAGSADGVQGLVELQVGNDDVANVTLTAVPPFTLNGRLNTEGALRPALPGFSQRRSITLRSLIPQLPSATTPIAPDGTFTFKGESGVYSGDYQVSVQDSPNSFVKSIRLGNQDVLTDGLRIRTPPESQLDIGITSSIGTLVGRVVNERHEPVANAVVVVIPDPPVWQTYLTPIADVTGKFQIGTMPGRYKVFAWEDVAPRAWLDPDFIRSNESRSRSVTIGDGGTENIELTVIPFVP